MNLINPAIKLTMRYSVTLAVSFLLTALSPIGAQTRTPAFLLFGDTDHRTFLGCLNCSRYDAASICNRYGDYGSRYNSGSIWNRYGDYGSRYADTSPWNKYASNPPIIVDVDGNSYGYFTSNRTMAARTTIKAFLLFLNNVDEVNEDLEAARNLFCGQ